MKSPLICTLAVLAAAGSLSLRAQDPGYREAERRQQPAATPQAQAPAQSSDDTAAAASRISSMSSLDDIRPLKIGDRVSLRIVEDRDKVYSLDVQDSGDIVTPFLTLVKASGLTCKQVAFFMKRELEKQYFQQATVIIALERARQERQGRAGMAPDDMGYITIYGQVARQGRYELAPEEELTISQAILRAGGLAQFANAKKVVLIRKVPGKGSVNILVNVDDIMTKGRMDKDILIRNDDVIIVKEKFVNF